MLSSTIYVQNYGHDAIFPERSERATFNICLIDKIF
jgi:hypothetical protein